MRLLRPIAVLLSSVMLAGSGWAGELSISPAAAEIALKPGARVSQRIVIRNSTTQTFDADVVAFDISAESGRPVLVPSGGSESSIADSAMLSEWHVHLAPGQERKVEISVVVPLHTDLRAVAVLFRATTPMISGKTSMLPSIGSVLTFTTGEPPQVEAGSIEVSPQDTASGLAVAQQIRNRGRDRAIVSATAAIRDSRSRLVGKLAIEPRRLLPGEVAVVRSEYPGVLPPGEYQVDVTYRAADAVIAQSMACATVN